MKTTMAKLTAVAFAVLAFHLVPADGTFVENPVALLLGETLTSAISGDVRNIGSVGDDGEGCILFNNEIQRNAFLAEIRSTVLLSGTNSAAARELIVNNLLPHAALWIIRGKNLATDLLNMALSFLDNPSMMLLSNGITNSVLEACRSGVNPDLIRIAGDTIHVTGCSNLHTGACTQIHLAGCSTIRIPSLEK